MNRGRGWSRSTIGHGTDRFDVGTAYATDGAALVVDVATGGET